MASTSQRSINNGNNAKLVINTNTRRAQSERVVTVKPQPLTPTSPPSPGSQSGLMKWLRGFPPTFILLVFVPISIVLRYSTDNQIAMFITACLGIVPLAGVMGDATENIAERFGAGVGGLLNATFGNAAELILACFGVFKGLDTLVKASLCGSIIGNILLVLGGSILTGGFRYKQQNFSLHAAHSEATMAVVAAVAFLVPAIFHSIINANAATNDFDESKLSLGISVLLIVTYCLMLYFQLRTHASWFNENGDEGDETMPLVEAPSEKSVVHRDTDVDSAALMETGDIVHPINPDSLPGSLPSSPRKARTLGSMIAFDPASVSPMVKKTYARKLIREDLAKKRAQDRFKRAATIAVPGMSSAGNSATNSPRIDVPRYAFGNAATEEESDTRALSLLQQRHPSSHTIADSQPLSAPPISRPVSIAEAMAAEVAAEEKPWSLRAAIFFLCLSCAFVALLSEVLTDSVEVAGKALGLSETFLGVIVVAIVGNAAEHSTALLSAWHNNINVSLSIAFGSALQIAMFVVPFTVMISYARAGEPMNLILSELEVFAVCVSVILSWMVVSAGSGLYWLLGLMLMMIYVIIALAFYFLPAVLAT